MTKKIRVAVLMGGKTPEHEISVISGTEVVRNIDRKKYDVLPVVISKTGRSWQLVSSEKLFKVSDPLSYKGTKKDLITSSNQIDGAKVLSGKVDVVFIAMHGPCGEDGSVQGMLELAGVPYTGSGVLASALGMDKLRFRMLLESRTIPIPEYVALRKRESLNKVFKVLSKPPYFVKPHNQGSSAGMSIVKSKKDLKKALDLAFTYSDIALIDEYLKGTEVTCGILGNDKPFTLPLVEIVPLKGEFFDYDSKYRVCGAEEIVPARVSKKMAEKIQKLALVVYKLIGCKGFSRVDFIIKNNRHPVVLEINTIPGLTPTSLLPKAAKAYGLDYSQLLDKIVTYADEK